MCQPLVIVRLNGTMCNRRFCVVSVVFVVDIALLDCRDSIDILRNTAGCHVRGHTCITFALIVEQDASETNTNTSADGLTG